MMNFIFLENMAESNLVKRVTNEIVFGKNGLEN
jgi:hypothetical protein